MEDDAKEIIEAAMEESHQLLHQIAQLAEKLKVRPTDQSLVDEIYRYTHTLKSNVALLPRSKSLSMLLQNVELILSWIHEGKYALTAMVFDRLLDAYDLSYEVLECLRSDQPVPPALEKSVFKCVSEVRLLTNPTLKKTKTG